jgi:hypothetical protein
VLQVSELFMVADVSDMIEVAKVLQAANCELSQFHNILLALSPVDMNEEFVAARFIG